MSEPLSETLMLELIDQLNERIDGGHNRVRQSVNDLTTEVRGALAKMTTQVANHGNRITVIETERKAEARADARRRGDVRERTVLLTTVTSMLVTIGLWALNHLLK